MKLGTILPNQKVWDMDLTCQLRQSDFPDLEGTTKKQVDGETRYHTNPTTYAIISNRNGKLKWFEIRGGESYAIKRKSRP